PLEKDLSLFIPLFLLSIRLLPTLSSPLSPPPVQYSTIQYSTVQIAQYNTVQRVQYSTGQYSAVQRVQLYSIVHDITVHYISESRVQRVDRNRIICSASLLHTAHS